MNDISFMFKLTPRLPPIEMLLLNYGRSILRTVAREIFETTPVAITVNRGW